MVALLHLAGHALAKGGLFLTADGVYYATKKYAIFHTRPDAAEFLAVRPGRAVRRNESRWPCRRKLVL